MRLLLDEHISQRIAEQLRARDHDVVAVTEVEDLRGRPDDEVFARAIAEGRAIVTYDTDYAALLRQRIAAEAPVTDVILVPKTRIPRGDRGHGPLLKALNALLEAPDVDVVQGRLLWLSDPDT